MSSHPTEAGGRESAEGSAEPAPFTDLGDPSLYLNRELSWLNFNWRVLAEALDEKIPLLERVKFLAIYANNLDEFFMIRVSGLRRQEKTGIEDLTVDGMTPSEQLQAIRSTLLEHLRVKCELWNRRLNPLLSRAGVRVVPHQTLGASQRKLLRRYFEEQVFPVLTPLAFDPAHPWPHISNLSLNLAVVIKDQRQTERFARLKVPDIFPRFLPAPGKGENDLGEYLGRGPARRSDFVRLEEVVAANLDMLFPGVEVVAGYPFRITRDADIEIEEDEAGDLLATIEEGIELRYFGNAVRLEINDTMPERIKNILISNLNLTADLVYSEDSMLGMADLMQLTRIERPDLKYPSFSPVLPAPFAGREGIFSVIARGDVLSYHPYDSFSPVVDFIRQAAADPDVMAIKQTLYRVGPNSPVVDALLQARQEGKQVAVVVELKARFDEEHNIAWARALEDEGVHVIHGVVGLKTHAKVCLVVRREGGRVVRYVHMSTGNYNPVTARLYTDIGLFSASPDLSADASDLFNSLTGYAHQQQYRKILTAPGKLCDEIVSRIHREVQSHRENGGGRLNFKMNALVDQKIIRSLYEASQEGVKVDLQVRGICCLRPRVPGLSDNIRVTSIVGRFLEHSRIFHFRNGGADEIFVGSADLMPRNLYRRVEVLFPIEDPSLKELLLGQVLRPHLADNQKSWELLADGSYRRIEPAAGEDPMDSQQWLLEHWGQEGE
jgi:polyphosphate kinase